MKRTIIVAGALAGMLTASPAVAQDYWCDRPRKPLLRYGATTYEELDIAQFDVGRYLQAMQKYVNCLTNEIEAAQHEAKRVVQDWNLLVSSFQ